MPITNKSSCRSDDVSFSILQQGNLSAGLGTTLPSVLPIANSRCTPSRYPAVSPRHGFSAAPCPCHSSSPATAPGLSRSTVTIAGRCRYRRGRPPSASMKYGRYTATTGAVTGLGTYRPRRCSIPPCGTLPLRTPLAH